MTEYGKSFRFNNTPKAIVLIRPGTGTKASPRILEFDILVLTF